MMKKALFALVPALFWMQISATTCSAQKVALSPVATRTVSSIRDEARAVQHNASIYQWQRVNREVDRIVAAAHKLPTAVPASSTLDDMLAAIHDLRAGRLNRNPDKIEDASKRILAASNALLSL